MKTTMNTTMTTAELSKLDSIKVLNTCINSEDSKVIMTSENNQWAIQIHCEEFDMVLRYYMIKSPLDVLSEGVKTWSMTVRNSRGKTVMYISNLSPQVSTEMGRIISKHEQKKNKDTSISDWKELEKFASL